jgi:hypothetical protein
MLAPHCERDEFKSPDGHTSDYYFAPARIITGHEPFNLEKKEYSSCSFNFFEQMLQM